MSIPTKPVFLSYASQDAEPASRICDALRAAGVDVWFDQSALRGGDAWDVSIRRQIKECALFVPIISANTQAREEGYFRREWNLACNRMLDGYGRRSNLPAAGVSSPRRTAAMPPTRSPKCTRCEMKGTPRSNDSSAPTS